MIAPNFEGERANFGFRFVLHHSLLYSPLTFVGEEDGGVPLALADALALALAHAVPLPPLALPAATKSTAVSLKVN